jgi:hypothetical protein
MIVIAFQRELLRFKTFNSGYALKGGNENGLAEFGG